MDNNELKDKLKRLKQEKISIFKDLQKISEDNNNIESILREINNLEDRRDVLKNKKSEWESRKLEIRIAIIFIVFHYILFLCSISSVFLVYVLPKFTADIVLISVLGALCSYGGIRAGKSILKYKFDYNKSYDTELNEILKKIESKQNQKKLVENKYSFNLQKLNGLNSKNQIIDYEIEKILLELSKSEEEREKIFNKVLENPLNLEQISNIFDDEKAQDKNAKTKKMTKNENNKNLL